jgi:ribosome-associated protein
MIDEAFVRQPPRLKTKVGKAARARRVDAKKGRSVVKKGRGKVALD